MQQRHHYEVIPEGQHSFLCFIYRPSAIESYQVLSHYCHHHYHVNAVKTTYHSAEKYQSAVLLERARTKLLSYGLVAFGISFLS